MIGRQPIQKQPITIFLVLIGVPFTCSAQDGTVQGAPLARSDPIPGSSS